MTVIPTKKDTHTTTSDRSPRDVQLPFNRYENMKKLALDLKEMCAVPPERQRIMSIINASKELTALFNEKVYYIGARPKRRREVQDVQGDRQGSLPADQKAGR